MPHRSNGRKADNVSKWFVVIVGIFGALFLINTYIPNAWSAGFTLPIGHGVHVPYALCMLGAFIVVAARLKAK